MEIQRINEYNDKRFSNQALLQHGAYLVDGKPYEIEIIRQGHAVIRGEDKENYKTLIEEFLFHAPHIYKFYDELGCLIFENAKPDIINIDIADIQPSQFFIDSNKLEAVMTFIHSNEDVVIQVTACNGRFISLDGHTRLYAAYLKGFNSVSSVVADTDNYIWDFVAEAKKRGIYHVKDMKLLSHHDYKVQWDEFCNLYFENCN